MKTDLEKTIVKFYKEDGGILAVFPCEIADGQFNRLCYSHVGQHSACSDDYVKELKPASPREYSDLKTELENIGYNLQVN